jgi:hypothetical protein
MSHIPQVLHVWIVFLFLFSFSSVSQHARSILSSLNITPSSSSLAAPVASSSSYFSLTSVANLFKSLSSSSIGQQTNIPNPVISGV